MASAERHQQATNAQYLQEEAARFRAERRSDEARALLANLEDENQRLKIELATKIVLPKTGAMPPREVLEALAVRADEPWFMAVQQELAGLAEETTRVVEVPAATNEARAHAAGGLFALRDARERLEALREQGNKAVDEAA